MKQLMKVRQSSRDDLEPDEYIFHTTHTGTSGCVGEKGTCKGIISASLG